MAQLLARSRQDPRVRAVNTDGFLKYALRPFFWRKKSSDSEWNEGLYIKRRSLYWRQQLVRLGRACSRLFGA